MRRSAVMTIAVFTALALLAPPAAADSMSYADPKDTPGRLDVKTLMHGHREGSGRLAHTIEMHDRWRNRALRGSTSAIYLYFDIDGDRRTERRLTIDVRDGTLSATMRKAGRVIGHPKVWRADRRTVRVAFRRRLLRRGIDTYRWAALTVFGNESSFDCYSGRDVSATCYDYVPTSQHGPGDAYVLTHDLR